LEQTAKRVGIDRFKKGRITYDERAGFIDAPEINAKKKISRPTIPPIAIPSKPLKPLVYTTMKITAIRRADANTSIPKTRGMKKL
jgi:hypothetical protein